MWHNHNFYAHSSNKLVSVWIEIFTVNIKCSLDAYKSGMIDRASKVGAQDAG